MTSYDLPCQVYKINSKNPNSDVKLMVIYSDKCRASWSDHKHSELEAINSAYIGARISLRVHSDGREELIPDEEQIKKDTTRTKKAIDDFMKLGDED